MRSFLYEIRDAGCSTFLPFGNFGNNTSRLESRSHTDFSAEFFRIGVKCPNYAFFFSE